MIQHGTPTPRDLERRTVPPDGRPLDAQPRWRQDFPIDWPQDDYVSRRDLVNALAMVHAATARVEGLTGEALNP